MQILGMYGYVDKYDFVIATARALNIMSKSVLVIDATADKKYKYIVPTIDKTDRYITQYGEIDFAVGFESYESLEEFLRENNIDINLYSYVLIDVENAEMYKKFKAAPVSKSYMYIDTNVLSVAKNEELVRTMREENPEQELVFSKILYRAYLSRASTTYLEDRIATYAVRWSDEVYDISTEEQDMMVNIDSQFSGLIDLRKHTKSYLNFMCEYISKITGESSKDVLKEIKRRKN